MGPTKKKILLLLLGGVALGCAYLPHQQRRVLRDISREWKRIDRQKLQNDTSALYKSKLIVLKQNPDGSYRYTLSDKGKSKALTYKFQKMKIPKHKWDKKWRLVSFDIPEDYRKGRDALRQKLRLLGFRELQKSVFVFPFECRKEIEFVAEFFGVRKYVRYGILEFIDNDRQLRKIFKLL